MLDCRIIVYINQVVQRRLLYRNQKGQIYTENAQYNEACDTYRQSLPVITDSDVIMRSMRILGCRMN